MQLPDISRYAVRFSLIVALLCVVSVAVVARKPGDLGPRSQTRKTHRDLAYVENGHSRQKLDLYLPESSSGPLPLLIWIHGGAWLAGSKEQCFPLRMGFVEKGYAVASIGYRLSSDAPFPAQIEDCKAAIRWLRANAAKYGLDSQKFGVWGSSAGGHLAAMVGTTGDTTDFDKGANRELSSRVQAVCDFYGPSDLLRFAVTPGYESHAGSQSPESRLIGGAVLENKDKAERASPVTFISKEDPPFLIIHGDKDPTVAPQQSELLHAALKRAGVPSEHHVLPGAGHGGPAFNAPKVIEQVDTFFRQNLKIVSQSAVADPPTATKSDSTLPTITEFKREGDRWTCLADGKPLRGILVLPEGKGPFPALLISHGLGSNATQFALPKVREFVKWGMVCIAPDYTHSNPGRGRNPRLQEGPPQGELGASAENIRRARACLAILRTLPEADSKRVCAYGNSMGAFLTIGLAAAEPDALMAAAITAGGVAPRDGLPAPSTTQAAKIKTPFLILHGSADQTVPPERSAQLQTILNERKTSCDRRVFEGIGHNLHREKSEEVYRLIREWFTKHKALSAP
jgi:acetyl esterase/lipase